MKIANRNASQYVQNKEVFRGSNMYAEYEGKMYIVYSYGDHFPMYVFHRGRWYRNTDKYSVTTSIHQSHAMPYGEKFVERDTKELRNMIWNHRMKLHRREHDKAFMVA